MTRQEGLIVIARNPAQTRPAARLIESLGLDAAIAACRANAWDGVLQCILAYRSGIRKPAA